MPHIEDGISESERWMSVILGGMLVLSSLRRRDLLAGAAFAVGGSALIFRGISGGGSFLSAVRGLVESGRERRLAEHERARPEVREFEEIDEVDEASMESFPASDAPAWTATSSVDSAD